MSTTIPSPESEPRMFTPLPLTLELHMQHISGESVLAAEAEKIRGAVELLSVLSKAPGDEILLPVVAAAATDESRPVMSAIEYLPYINGALVDFSPKQKDPGQPDDVRHTQDWKAVKDAVEASVKDRPEVALKLTEWFMGMPHFTETTYGSGKGKKRLKLVAGAANEQCELRSVLSMASMATPEFREENGLTAASDASLDGKDGQAKHWAQNQQVIDSIRQHVAGRASKGEIEHETLVMACTRTPSDTERAVIQKHLDRAGITQPLYETIGFTEADAFLAGALNTFRGKKETIQITDVTTEDRGIDRPDKYISFDSDIGPVKMIVTADPKEYNIADQFRKAASLDPALIQDINGVDVSTTAIYTQTHELIARHGVLQSGLPESTDVQALGVSAHAAGIGRHIHTLVGELVNYLRAAHSVAAKVYESQEGLIRFSAAQNGGSVAIRGAVRAFYADIEK